MTKVLVVDDETDLEILIKQKFRKSIRENKYTFEFAFNGVEALKKIAESPDIDFVLSDINMPEMDGLTLLTKLHESHPLIKAVIISAYGDMENIRVAMNRGAFDFITKPINFADLSLTMEKTIDHINQIRRTLQAVKENNILRMYVDENVLNFMGNREYEASLTANENIEATVVFIDICGFTKISETASAETVVHLLNHYFDVIVKEIIDQGGYIDKFIGDAVMAVFKDEFHLDKAIEASLAVRARIEELPESPEGIHFSPQVSIGINTGEMISGNIGSASLKRLDYTVIGDTVNTAQRLESAALPNQILINAAAYEQVKDSFNCNKVGEINLKNKAKPTTVYEVLD
jgi:class 3 adenylate cyclase